MIEEEEEEEEEDSGPPQYIEPLGAALAQRGQKSDQPHVGFSNPAFSTTDLWWREWRERHQAQASDGHMLLLWPDRPNN